MASIDQIRELREQTGVSVSECKKALEETGSDFDKAKEVLRKWGKELAGKKSSREVRQGIIESYVHPNKKVGVLLDIRCETDFVAKSKDFSNLAHELCLHIAAMRPLFLEEGDIPEEFLDGEKKIYAEQMKDSGKPDKIMSQIIEGKLRKYKEEVCLFSQVWIKDDQKTIKDLINDYIAKLGENIIVKQFSRFEI
jgi:elongation factor Ts